MFIAVSLVAQLVKNMPAMQETWIQSLGWEDPPGKGNGNPLQNSGLENSMDCIVHGFAKSWTQLSNFYLLTYIYIYIYMESRKIILMNLSSGKEWKYRHREQTYGHRGGRRG